MCYKDSESSKCWHKFGGEATTHGIKGLVFIGAHWEELDDHIRVATKTDPMDRVPRSYWENYPINIDTVLASRVVSLLRKHSFDDVEQDPTFDWHDDTITTTRWIFPDGTPPAAVVSLNARYNPVFHVKIGRALRELRKEGILLCGTGGAAHNLYRNNWYPLLRGSDNFQPGSKLAQWAVDVVTGTKGAQLAGALIRLTESPRYEEAHPTDEHFFPAAWRQGCADMGSFSICVTTRSCGAAGKAFI